MKTMKEKITDLANGWKEDKDVLDMIKKNVGRIQGYVDSVVTMECLQPVIYAKYEGEEIRDRIMDLDQKRRIAHEAAISAVSQLVRWAGLVNVEPVYTGDLDDRWQIADFCIEFVKNVFDGRTKGGISHTAN